MFHIFGRSRLLLLLSLVSLALNPDSCFLFSPNSSFFQFHVFFFANSTSSIAAHLCARLRIFVVRSCSILSASLISAHLPRPRTPCRTRCWFTSCTVSAKPFVVSATVLAPATATEITRHLPTNVEMRRQPRASSSSSYREARTGPHPGGWSMGGGCSILMTAMQTVAVAVAPADMAPVAATAAAAAAAAAVAVAVAA